MKYVCEYLNQKHSPSYTLKRVPNTQTLTSSNTMNSNQSYQPTTRKMMIVGDSGVGKTTLVKRLRTGEYEKKHLCTLGVEVHPIHHDRSNIVVNAWDCAGDKRFLGIGKGYYTKASHAIIMIDVTNKDTTKGVNKYIRELREASSCIKILLCVNKNDVSIENSPNRFGPQERKYIKKIIKEMNVGYIGMSVASMYGYNDLMEFMFEKNANRSNL